MSLLGTLGAITRNAKAIQEIAIAASKDLASVNNNTVAKKDGLPVFKVRTEPTTAKVATVIPEGTPEHLKRFYNLEVYFREMGLENYRVLKVDESASYYIVFLKLHLNMKTRVLSNQEELSKLSMKLGTDYESMVYSGKTLLDGKPCFLLGFPKHEKGKLELSTLLNDMPEEAKRYKMPFAVCQRVDKSIYWVDLVKAGHSKIIGASGAGKSVFLNSLVTQVMRNKKAELFLIDMKQSEKDWGAVSRELPPDHFGNTFNGAIKVLDNILKIANERRTSGNSDPIVLIIEEADKMMNAGLVDDENPIDQQFPSKEQHRKLRQQMALVSSELRSLGVICFWVGQGALPSEVGANIIRQFKTVYGMTVADTDASKNATGRAGQYLNLLSGNGDMQVYCNGKRVRGNSPFCSQEEAVIAVRNKYKLNGE